MKSAFSSSDLEGDQLRVGHFKSILSGSFCLKEMVEVLCDRIVNHA